MNGYKGDYNLSTQEKKTTTKQYTGWYVWRPSDAELADFFVERYIPEEIASELLDNQYLIIKPQKDENAVTIYRIVNGVANKISRPTFKGKASSDASKGKKSITPKNIEQQCAFDLLASEDITLKLLTGTWGCGKTFLLVAAALDALSKKKFKKIVWIRNNIEVKDTRDLGALPGDINEKLLPYLGPFIDHVGSKEKVLRMIETGQLEVEPLQTLRGRNIEDAIIMCSEAENLTKEHIQLLIARVAEGSNLWMDGDWSQRDRVSFEKSKGLEVTIDRLKGEHLFGYVHLVKGERSETASLADKLND